MVHQITHYEIIQILQSFKKVIVEGCTQKKIDIVKPWFNRTLFYVTFALFCVFLCKKSMLYIFNVAPRFRIR